VDLCKIERAPLLHRESLVRLEKTARPDVGCGTRDVAAQLGEDATGEPGRLPGVLPHSRSGNNKFRTGCLPITTPILAARAGKRACVRWVTARLAIPYCGATARCVRQFHGTMQPFFTGGRLVRQIHEEIK
jgi:hypothetical protein